MRELIELAPAWFYVALPATFVLPLTIAALRLKRIRHGRTRIDF